ncbi:hypothetical protein M8C21_029505, partial [Ambrosia artemisiifolia]
MNGGDVAAAPDGPPPPLEWKFSQVFGERTAGEEVQEVDIISAIEFDKSGDHLATGDRGGRVVLFERTDKKEVQEKKIKKIADFNMEPSKLTGNGNVASSSVTSTSKPHLANGGYSDKLFPPGGIPSLRLP